MDKTNTIKNKNLLKYSWIYDELSGHGASLDGVQKTFEFLYRVFIAPKISEYGINEVHKFCNVIKNKNHDHQCILFNSTAKDKRASFGKKRTRPNVELVKIWRWPGINARQVTVKHIDNGFPSPAGQYSKDNNVEVWCINPYHYSYNDNIRKTKTPKSTGINSSRPADLPSDEASYDFSDSSEDSSKFTNPHQQAVKIENNEITYPDDSLPIIKVESLDEIYNYNNESTNDYSAMNIQNNQISQSDDHSLTKNLQALPSFQEAFSNNIPHQYVIPEENYLQDSDYSIRGYQSMQENNENPIVEQPNPLPACAFENYLYDSDYTIRVYQSLNLNTVPIVEPSPSWSEEISFRNCEPTNAHHENFRIVEPNPMPEVSQFWPGEISANNCEPVNVNVIERIEPIPIAEPSPPWSDRNSLSYYELVSGCDSTNVKQNQAASPNSQWSDESTISNCEVRSDQVPLDHVELTPLKAPCSPWSNESTISNCEFTSVCSFTEKSQFKLEPSSPKIYEYTDTGYDYFANDREVSAMDFAEESTEMSIKDEPLPWIELQSFNENYNINQFDKISLPDLDGILSECPWPAKMIESRFFDLEKMQVAVSPQKVVPQNGSR